MSKVLKNVTEAPVEVKDGLNRITFDPGEVKTVHDEFPSVDGLEEVDEAKEADKAADEANTTETEGSEKSSDKKPKRRKSK